MGAGFCSLYREIHYIKVRYIKICVYLEQFFFVSDHYPNKKYENECTKLCAYCIIIRWHYIYFWSWVDSYSFLLATFTMLPILSKKWENPIPY